MNLAATLQDLPNWSSHPRLQRALQRAATYLPTAAMILLVILIAWQLARITWMLFPSPANEVVIAQQFTPPKTGDTINTQRIADAHLFGSASAPDTSDVANAPQTQMTLVLAGVMAAPDASKGFAFIGETAATAKLIHVGDPIGGSAKLHSVFVDHVILDRGGRMESLMLPRYSGSNSVPLMAASQAPQPARFAENARRIMETNPSAFSEIVRPQPVFNGSKLQGYRVYPGRNRQQFGRLGLRPGDLVTAVSGTPLTDQSSAMQIFNTISSTDRVTLTVEREGQSQQVTINTGQIELPDPNAPPAAAPGAQQTPPSPVPMNMQPTAQPTSQPALPPNLPPGAQQRPTPSDGTPGVITPEVQ